MTTRPAPAARMDWAADRASAGVRATLQPGTGSPWASSSPFASAAGRLRREAHAVAQADQKPGKLPRENLGRRQAAGIARTSQARAQNKVCSALLDRRKHVGHHLGTIAAVTVDEQHGPRPWR